MKIEISPRGEGKKEYIMNQRKFENKFTEEQKVALTKLRACSTLIQISVKDFFTGNACWEIQKNHFSSFYITSMKEALVAFEKAFKDDGKFKNEKKPIWKE